MSIVHLIALLTLHLRLIVAYAITCRFYVLCLMIHLLESFPWERNTLLIPYVLEQLISLNHLCSDMFYH